MKVSLGIGISILITSEQNLRADFIVKYILLIILAVTTSFYCSYNLASQAGIITTECFVKSPVDVPKCRAIVAQVLLPNIA
jgi:hypothetical protein